jgi:putative tryptophan/tyrosine transport system substrate-binding protein
MLVPKPMSRVIEMRRRDFFLAASMLVPVMRHAMAQQSGKTKRVAMVYPSDKVADVRTDPNFAIFLEEFKRHGYVEGTNLIIDIYSGEGRIDRYGDLAREVVSTHPDVIWCTGSPLARQFKAATSTIPIVAITGDPIRQGIVSSIARPGGNITGVSVDAGFEIWPKRLELLAEAVPKLVNVAYVSTLGGWNGAGARGLREAAPKLGISLVPATLGNTVDEAEYRRIFGSIQRDQVDGIMISEESENYTYRFLLVQLVQQIRLPAIFSYRDQAEAGGLMSYSWDIKGAVWRNAMQIVEILKGGNPSDMPYFQEVRFELVINLKTAKALGLDIPAGLVARADAMIE